MEEIEVDGFDYSEAEFIEYLDEIFGDFIPENMVGQWGDIPRFSASDTFRELDPIAYQEMYNNWESMRINEAQNELIIEEEEPKKSITSLIKDFLPFD